MRRVVPKQYRRSACCQRIRKRILLDIRSANRVALIEQNMRDCAHARAHNADDVVAHGRYFLPAGVERPRRKRLNETIIIRNRNAARNTGMMLVKVGRPFRMSCIFSEKLTYGLPACQNTAIALMIKAPI